MEDRVQKRRKIMGMAPQDMARLRGEITGLRGARRELLKNMVRDARERRNAVAVDGKALPRRACRNGPDDQEGAVGIFDGYQGGCVFDAGRFSQGPCGYARCECPKGLPDQTGMRLIRLWLENRSEAACGLVFSVLIHRWRGKQKSSVLPSSPIKRTASRACGRTSAMITTRWQ